MFFVFVFHIMQYSLPFLELYLHSCFMVVVCTVALLFNHSARVSYLLSVVVKAPV